MSKTCDLLSRHSVAYYDFKAQPIFLSKGQDMYRKIAIRASWIVDTHCQWKAHAAGDKESAFILGETVTSESDNLDGVFFNEKTDFDAQNVFVFGVEELTGSPALAIHCLDSAFEEIFDRPIPRLTEYSEEGLALWNDPKKRIQLIARVRGLLNKSDLPSKIELQAGARQCAGDFVRSCAQAEIAFAFLLNSTRKRDRTLLRRFEDNHPNLFKDTALIRDALFFGCSILSNDSHARTMAGLLGIPCSK